MRKPLETSTRNSSKSTIKMPLYWRNFYPRRRYLHRRRRWRRTRRWPFRRTIQRRHRRRRWVRKRHFIKKKLKTIKIRQWQPKTIHKCHIKGTIPLFICGKTRIAHNYALYKESGSKKGEATGGAWSIQNFCLKMLYDEYIRYKNFWTRSNQGLPLVRFVNVKLKFYKSMFTDYIATIVNCPPFTVTKDMFLNTQPQRMLMERKKILVPQLTSATRKKYKKITVRTRALLTNKWYFQQDMCSTPLIMITASACSFSQPYAPENQVSDAITLYSLDTNTFQNSDFYSIPDNEGYIPKHLGTQKMHLYGVNNSGTEPPKKWKDVLYLGNTKTYFPGNFQPPTHIGDLRSINNWGNPFANPWNHEDHIIYYSTSFPATTDDLEKPIQFTPLEALYITCRYNPQKDKGTGNIVYLKKNDNPDETDIGTLPTNERLILKDYPLWLSMWGWTDWLKRVPEAQQINDNYFLVVKSPYIYPPRPYYVFLDLYFVKSDGKDLTNSDKAKWHPKYEMQTEAEFFLAQTGPYAPKVNRSELIQANLGYDFFFKWGGCPAPMEHIVNPGEQEKYPVPNSELQTYEIQDPETPKQTYLYEWDERRAELTKTCTKRIKKDSTFGKSFTDFSSINPPVQTQQTESEEETTSEEDETPLQQQLQQLRDHQRHLRRQLLRLTKKQSLE
nr:MAG: ORF1 [TTV-like mini virus]